MINTHLHILHLKPNTDDAKVNKVAEERFINLTDELNEQEITDYTIIEGIYDKDSPRTAIMKGHKLIVQLAKNNDFPNVIIAEDDLKFLGKGAWQYYLSQFPQDYDLFLSMIYSGDIDYENRITNGFSAMTLYTVHNKFYDFFLSMPDDEYVDRKLGDTAYLHKYYVCNPFICIQRGTYSYHKREAIDYMPLLDGRKLFGRDLLIE